MPTDPHTGVDPVLADIRLKRMQAEDAVIALYDAIRWAKANGYSYSELDTYTGFSRGNIQNITAGRNPRFVMD